MSPAGVSDLLVAGPWTHELVAANGARFHVVACGVETDPLVLFLHGFPEFWWAWRHQLPAVAATGVRAVAMDLRGFGASDKTPRGYDPFTIADDIAGVIRCLGATDAVLVGHGWGGFEAWATAVLHPSRVRALAALSAPHPLQLVRSGLRGGQLGSVRQVSWYQLPILPERRLLARGGEYVTALLRSWSASPHFPDGEADRRYRTALQVWPAPHCALEYDRWLVRSRLRHDGRRFSAAMRAPVRCDVLQLHGTADRAVRLTSSAAPSQLVTGAYRYESLPGVGHFPHEEAPELVNRLLTEWLAELPSP